MCYGYKFVRKPDGTFASFTHIETQRLVREGKIKEEPDGYHFARDTIPAILQTDDESKVIPMRWDLIPSFYLQSEKLTVAEVIKRKNSRAKNPATGKSWGFSSYNARIESVRTLPSFRRPWENSQRCIISVDAFRERPNIDDAPKEFKGREYEINLPQTMFFGGLWDSWQGKDGEILNSCTVITTSSEGIEPLRKIWHERVPILFNDHDAEIWMDPKTTPERAFKICQPILGDELDVKELPHD